MLQVDRPITWWGERGGRASKHSKHQLIYDTSNFLFVTVNHNS